MNNVFQVEIDEFQNYDKAAGALNEAYKVITASSDPKVQEKLPALKYKLEKVTQFNGIKR